MNYALGGGALLVAADEGGALRGRQDLRRALELRRGRDPGPFTASTFTRNAETGRDAGAGDGRDREDAEGGPTAAELDAAKGNLIGGNGLKLETGADVARSLLIAELDGLTGEFVEKYPARLKAVTLKQAIAAASAHLHPTALVIVGKAEEIKPMLAKAKLDWPARSRWSPTPSR